MNYAQRAINRGRGMTGQSSGGGGLETGSNHGIDIRSAPGGYIPGQNYTGMFYDANGNMLQNPYSPFAGGGRYNPSGTPNTSQMYYDQYGNQLPSPWDATGNLIAWDQYGMNLDAGGNTGGQNDFMPPDPNIANTGQTDFFDPPPNNQQQSSGGDGAGSIGSGGIGGGGDMGGNMGANPFGGPTANYGIGGPQDNPYRKWQQQQVSNSSTGPGKGGGVTNPFGGVNQGAGYGYQSFARGGMVGNPYRWKR